jgi:hypothetical protein
MPGTVFPRRLWREVLCIFLASGIFFALLALPPSFPDPDSFYHARLAVLMRDGPVLSFPWLPLTSLGRSFIDHHFLYHVLLIPFVIIGNPLIGLKVATILFASGFIALFYRIMRSAWLSRAPLSRSAALLCTGALLLNTVFTFRINLAKIPAVSLFVFFCGIIAVGKKNLKAIFGLSFLFVWLYGGWPLMPIMALLAWITLSATALPANKKFSLIPLLRAPHPFSFIQECMRTYTTSLARPEHYRIPLFSFLGAAAGLIINPYFPTNLQFYWVQTIKIAVLNIISDIPVGSEWYPPGMSFVPAHGPTLMILVFALCIFFLPGLFRAYFNVSIPARTWQQWLLCLLSLSFFILTLKSRRYGEYFAPIATLFSAYALAPMLCREQILKLTRAIQKNMSALPTFNGIVTAYFLIMIPAIMTTNITQIVSVFQGGYGMEQYARGMQWIREHTSEQSLIFHNRWDDFPLFFYFNQRNRYISGLDPRFLLENNEARAKDLTIIQGGGDMTDVYGYRPLCLSAQETASRRPLSDTVTVPGTCLPMAEKDALMRAIKSFGATTIVLTHLDDASTKKIRELPGLKEEYSDNEMAILSLPALSP